MSRAHSYSHSRAYSPTLPLFYLHHSSFSNPSVALPTSQLILQAFRCFAYVTAHSPTLLSLLLRHGLFTYVTWRAAHGNWLLKCYWKVENWWVEFVTPPPTRATITRIQDRFEVGGTVQDVLKGRLRKKKQSTDNESANAVMQVFARSPKKSLRQCSHEIGIEKSCSSNFASSKMEVLRSETCSRTK